MSIYFGNDTVKDLYIGLTPVSKGYVGTHLFYNGDNTIIDITYEKYILNTQSNTLYNTAEKPVKSAILKGNTLLNLAPKMVDNVVSNYQGGNVAFTPLFTPLTNLKANTEYTLFIKVSELVDAKYTTYQYEGRNVNNAFVKYKIGDYTLVNGYNKITFTPNVELIKVQFISYNTFDIGGGCHIHGDSIILIEGNHSNEEIPYFTGMRSVKMPVLTTSNEDGTKTNILTVNEDVTLRSNGDIYDELNPLTGRLTQRIDENNEVLAQAVVKTVDLSVVDQDGNDTKLSTFNDITYVTLSSEGLIPEAELEVATKNEEVLNTMSLEMDDISTTQNALQETSNTQSENVDATMLATTEIYEGLL